MLFTLNAEKQNDFLMKKSFKLKIYLKDTSTEAAKTSKHA